MAHVQFHSWQPPLDKIALNRLLRERAGLSLGEAKRVVDQVVEGQPVTVRVTSPEVARVLVADAMAMGAHCEVVPAPAAQQAV